MTEHTSDAAYDPTTGAVTSQTDANNHISTMEYATTDALGNLNPLRRLTKVKRAEVESCHEHVK